MSILHLPASTTGEEVSAALAEYGAVIVDNLVSAAYMDRVADELRPWIDATEFGPDDFTGRRTKRTGGLVGRSQKCRATKERLRQASTSRIGQSAAR